MAKANEQETIEQEGEVAVERPDWLPDNFETPEAFAKSYQEAQSRLTQTSQRLSEVEDTLTAVLEAQQTHETERQQSQVPQNQWSPDDLRAAYDNDPLAVTALLVNNGVEQALTKFQQTQQQQWQPQQQATDEIAAELADNALRARYNDWGTKDEPGYNVKVAELIQRDPTLLPDGLTQSPQALANRLDMIYKIAKADDLIQGNAQAQTQAEADRAAKINAQTVTGAGGRQEVTAESDEDYAKSLIAAHNMGYGARMASRGL